MRISCFVGIHKFFILFIIYKQPVRENRLLFVCNILFTNIRRKIMKELIEILTDENKSFNFPWWVYMFVLPAVLVLLMAFAGWMDALSQGL